MKRCVGLLWSLAGRGGREEMAVGMDGEGW